MKIKVAVAAVAGFLVVAGLGGASIYFYTRYQHAQELLKNPTAAVSEEINALTSKVGSHIVLPKGETPTVATVTDKAKLAGQAFFAQAEAGDKVLLYVQAEKAILYRPSINKIIEVDPCCTKDNVAGASTASAQLSTARLAIYNSTDTAGLASVAEQKVNKDFANIQTIAKKNSKASFAKSQVVVLNSGAQTLGEELAADFKAEVKISMPPGEATPEGDLLLIVGQDFAH